MFKQEPGYGPDNPHPLSRMKTELNTETKGYNIRARIEF